MVPKFFEFVNTMEPSCLPCSTIPMQNLTAPGDWNRQNGALKHFSWSEGCFNFHFIDQDTTDGGPSEWEDYQGERVEFFLSRLFSK